LQWQIPGGGPARIFQFRSSTDRIATMIVHGPIGKRAGELLADNCEFAYLLGTADTERFRDDSDIDFAIYPKVAVTKEILAKLKLALEDEFSRDVDLVSLIGVDLIFGRQVIETGRLLFSQNPEIHLRWVAEQLSQYPDFKFSRKVIEDNLLTRKKYV
jgi:predicted nucleotidyltransferase